jgi:S-formylglutathione hydrolase FrmB
MCRIFAALALLAAVAACAGVPGTTTERIGADRTPGPRLTAVEGLNARVDRLSIQSPALGREGSVWVLKPKGWTQGSTGWPVLCLLHGCCVSRGDAWLVYGDAERITAGLKAVVVIPEGGEMSWYSNWLEGPAWETFHMNEVRPLVEGRYGTGERAILERNRRFVTAARTAGVAVTTDFYGAGAHDWRYWTRELEEVLPALLPG